MRMKLRSEPSVKLCLLSSKHDVAPRCAYGRPERNRSPAPSAFDRALGRKTYELEVAGEASRDWT